ncbi:hypothetical protein V5N11_026560 [Cardamine amara subsp. amara]|uniref:Uncharacterized protein n=1 Tax=Cardamine amara subsp. amara TaxID=228776 RepID=A0ABD0ZNJ7_CARAN
MEEIIESEISERDDVSSNPPLLESCEEIEEGEEIGSKGDLTKAMVLVVIVLAGLLLSLRQILRISAAYLKHPCWILDMCIWRSQTSLLDITNIVKRI